MRLIDADALGKLLQARTREGLHPEYRRGAFDCMTILAAAPTVILRSADLRGEHAEGSDDL